MIHDVNARRECCEFWDALYSDLMLWWHRTPIDKMSQQQMELATQILRGRRLHHAEACEAPQWHLMAEPRQWQVDISRDAGVAELEEICE